MRITADLWYLHRDCVENKPAVWLLFVAEAIVRGHKTGLLTVPDYNNLTQCEALDDIKLNLVSGCRVVAGASSAGFSMDA